MAPEVGIMFIQHRIHSVTQGEGPGEGQNILFLGVEGVDAADWRDTYGVKSDGKGLTLGFVTQGPYSTNIGSRMYLLAPGGDEYQIFKLKNKETNVPGRSK